MAFSVTNSAYTQSLTTGTTRAKAFPGAVAAGSTLVAGAVLYNANGGVALSASDTVNGAWPTVNQKDVDVTRALAVVCAFPNTAAGTPTVTLTASAAANSDWGFIFVAEVVDAAVASLEQQTLILASVAQ